MSKATHSGTCQVCGRLQKLPGGVLAKHGYDVKFGFFNGVCWGQGHKPFEQAVDCIEKAIQWAESEKASIEKAVAELNARPIGNDAPFRRYLSGTFQRKAGYKWQTVTLVQKDNHILFVFKDGTTEPSFRYSLHGTMEEIVTTLRARRVEYFQKDIDERVTYINWQQHRLDTWKPGTLVAVGK